MTQIFIINLKKATTKLATISKELDIHSLKASIFEAIDGSQVKLPQSLKKWYDPYTHLTLTCGELGCALSHFNLWQKIIDENIEKAIIIEDDITIIDNQFQKKIDEINANEFDLIYLGRKKMSTIEEESFDTIYPTLVKTSYSYWTCAYAISYQGAKLLANELFLHNIIPIDEYLPLMYNASPIDYLKETFATIIKPDFKCFAFRTPLLKPKINGFNESSTFFSKPVIIERSDVILVTVATEMNDAVKRYISSCQNYGFTPEILGLNDNWKGGDMSIGMGGGQKVNLLREFLNSLVDNNLIIFTDSYDVIANNNINIFLDTYHSLFSSKIVFATEIYCWPDKSLKDKYPKRVNPSYLNSGLFVGYKDELLKIIANHIDDHEDDQLYYSKAFLNNNSLNNICLDYNNDLFLCMNGIINNIIIDNRKSCIHYNNKRPTFIHANGPSSIKLRLNSISNYCVNGYNEIYGYKCRESDISEICGISKILIILVETISISPEFIKGLLIQDYPKAALEIIYVYKTTIHDFKDDDIFINHTIKYTSNIYKHILEYNKCINASYIFYITTNSILTSSNCLKDLVKENKSVIGPLITNQSNLFSNFWGDLDSNGYYKRSNDYIKILKRELKGCWNVPYIWYALLIKREFFTEDNFRKELFGEDDIDMNFCSNLRKNNIFMNLLNTDEFGYFLETNICNLTSYLTNQSKWESTYLDSSFRNLLETNQDIKLNKLEDNIYKIQLFNKQFCNEIISICEESNKWSKGGDTHYDKRIHNNENYPTQDIHLNQIGLEKMWKYIVKTYIEPIIYKEFYYSTKDINISFVVKYNTTGQKDLKPHHDSSTYTINLCLNDQFIGGGCNFIRQNLVLINKDIGSLIIHPGKLTHYHEGLEITDGVRYILVSFVI